MQFYEDIPFGNIRNATVIEKYLFKSFTIANAKYSTITKFGLRRPQEDIWFPRTGRSALHSHVDPRSGLLLRGSLLSPVNVTDVSETELLETSH
jgi:hypothetical protein